MQNTVDRVVKASSLPLSIVIVGVGEADFSKMVRLTNAIKLHAVKFNCTYTLYNYVNDNA